MPKLHPNAKLNQVLLLSSLSLSLTSQNVNWEWKYKYIQKWATLHPRHMATLAAKARANVAACPTRRMSEGNLHIHIYTYILWGFSLETGDGFSSRVTNESHYYILNNTKSQWLNEAKCQHNKSEPRNCCLAEFAEINDTSSRETGDLFKVQQQQQGQQHYSDPLQWLLQLFLGKSKQVGG